LPHVQKIMQLLTNVTLFPPLENEIVLYNNFGLTQEILQSSNQIVNEETATSLLPNLVTTPESVENEEVTETTREISSTSITHREKDSFVRY